MKEREMYRIRKGKWIAGVCTGMADYMNLPVYVIRLIFVAMVPLAFGAGIFVYIASILMVHWAPEGYIPAGEETPEETDEAESEE